MLHTKLTENFEEWGIIHTSKQRVLLTCITYVCIVRLEFSFLDC